MPIKAKELSDAAVRKLKHGYIKGNPKVPQANRSAPIGTPCPAYHAVGGVAGLLLQCRPPVGDSEIGSKSWILRTMVGAKRRDIGLGGYPDVTLSDARNKARELKEQIKQGIDPIVRKKELKSALIAEQAKVVTFEILAAEYVAKKAKEFKTAKQVQKLEQQLKSYAYPFLGKLVVADIERAHILNMLTPIWETKTETASRVRMYVERILDLGGVKGLRSGDNPARLKGNLDLSLAKREKVNKVVHYKALPFSDLPDFLSQLSLKTGVSPRVLEFVILTAARPSEAREALWSEIDLEARTWTIPAERMKSNKRHVVPLSQPAVALIESMPRLSEYVFTGVKGGSISDAMVSKVPKTLGRDVTAHGFRSTFKDWCSECTEYPDEVSELALAHVNDDKTRAAYARSELIDKRRLLMDEWAEFCKGGTEQ